MSRVSTVAPILAAGAVCATIGVLLLKIKGLEERLEAATEGNNKSAQIDQNHAAKSISAKQESSSVDNVAPVPLAPTATKGQAKPAQGKVQPLKHKHTVGFLPTSTGNGGRGQAGGDSGPPVFAMEQIGTILSPFPHRAGTPRQGTLAPHARSHLVLDTSVPPSALEGLEGFSHVWVLFKFHINVESGKQRKASEGTRYAAKVKPPRARGAKVGVFATRAPHRPNPVGLSLCRVEKVDLARRTVQLLGLDLVDGTPIYDLKPYIPWDAISDGNSTKNSIRNNDVGKSTSSKSTGRVINESSSSSSSSSSNSQDKNDEDSLTSFMAMDEMRLPLKWGAHFGGGLSLAAPPSSTNSNSVNSSSSSSVTRSPCVGSSRSSQEQDILRVPHWVSDDTNEFASVTWTEEARAAVAAARAQGALGPLYPSLKKNKKSNADSSCNNNNSDDSNDDSNGGDEVCLAISEVIAQDPRAQKDGRGSCTSDPYSLTFATLRVAFEALPPTLESNLNAGEAGDGERKGGESGQSPSSSQRNTGRGRAVVVSVEPDPGDATAPPGSYQHSMYLRRCAEMEMKAAAAAKEGEDNVASGGGDVLTLPSAAPVKPSSKSSRSVAWAHPIREGVVQGLFALRCGGEWRPQAAATLEWVGY